MSHFAEDWGKQRYPCQNGLMPFGITTKRISKVPKAVTQSPIVTGTSVIGVIYRNGVLMAADCLASYGSLARFRDVQRLSPVGNNTVLGTSGDISDLQALLESLQEIQIDEYTMNDGHHLSPWNYHHYIAELMYQRRSNMDPLWNSHIVGGVRNERKFLGYVDLLGTRYEASSIATGFGSYLAQPLLRKSLEEKQGHENLSFDDAKQLLEGCMRVLYYRDARSLNKIQMANITEQGVQISQPYIIESDWSIAEYVKGYK